MVRKKNVYFQHLDDWWDISVFYVYINKQYISLFIFCSDFVFVSLLLLMYLVSLLNQCCFSLGCKQLTAGPSPSRPLPGAPPGQNFYFINKKWMCMWRKCLLVGFRDNLRAVFPFFRRSRRQYVSCPLDSIQHGNVRDSVGWNKNSLYFLVLYIYINSCCQVNGLQINVLGSWFKSRLHASTRLH